jgi:peptidoglycan/xylan/chitin deacetylase (PgdA/CDA1 family)
MLVACAYVIFQMTVLGDSSKEVKDSFQNPTNVADKPALDVTVPTYGDEGDKQDPPVISNSKDPVKKDDKETSKDKEDTSKPSKSEQGKPAKKPDQDKAVEPAQPTEPTPPAAKGTKPLTGKIAYLTFDDGASPYTNQILDDLDEYDAKATFFMLEPNMRKHPDAVKRIVKDGHMPAMHGVTHQVKKYYASQTSVVNEMVAGQQRIKTLTGADTSLIRTPYGSAPYMKKEYMRAVKNAGFTLWDWNVDSLDWKYRDARFVNTVKQEVTALEKKNVSPVILMHDRKETMKYLPQVLKFLKDRGYQFKTLDDTLKPIQFSKS